MRALNLHLKVLIALLVSLGILVTAYQIFILGIPMTTDETDYLWNVDAKVEFQASSRDPVKVQMFVPPLNQDYVSLNESFISNNYGVSINRNDGNRKVTWSARRASGNQTLYYRLVLTKRYSDEKPKAKGPIFRESIAVEGAEKIAARWADIRKVPQIAFKPDWTKHAKAAPFKRNDQMLAVLPIGVIIFPGTGIQDNLADKARKLGIPVYRFGTGGA